MGSDKKFCYQTKTLNERLTAFVREWEKGGKRKRPARREGEEDQRGKQGFLEGSRVLFLAVLLSRTEGHPSSCQTNRFFRPITPDFEGNTVTKRCLWPGRTELLRNGNQLRTFQRQSQFQFPMLCRQSAPDDFETPHFALSRERRRIRNH